jgi:hypothetical protein
MSTVPYPPLRPLAVGEILDLAFRLYRGTLVKCLPLAALTVVVSQLPNLYLLLIGGGLQQRFAMLMRDRVYVALYVVTLTLAVVLYAAILLRQYRMATADKSGGELAVAARGAVTLGLLTALFSLVLRALASRAMLFPDRGPKVVLLLIVLLVFSYVVVTFSTAISVLMISGAPPGASLVRSLRLTRGSFWRVALVYTVAFVILMVLYILLGTATGLVAALAAHGDLAVVTAVYAVAVVAMGAFAVPFYMAVQLAVFGDLAARRNGTDLALRISATA